MNIKWASSHAAVILILIWLKMWLFSTKNLHKWKMSSFKVIIEVMKEVCATGLSYVKFCPLRHKPVSKSKECTFVINRAVKGRITKFDLKGYRLEVDEKHLWAAICIIYTFLDQTNRVLLGFSFWMSSKRMRIMDGALCSSSWDKQEGIIKVRSFEQRWIIYLYRSFTERAVFSKGWIAVEYERKKMKDRGYRN